MSTTFNIAKGAAAQLVRDNPNSLVLMLLKANEADDALNDYTDVQSLLAAAGNTEADFTGYARKTGITETITIDDTANSVVIKMPKQSWAAQTRTTQNTLTKIVIAVQSATAGDAGLIPLVAQDYDATTDNSNSVDIDYSVNGFYKAS
jgi:hypothetical protein